jgi:hypothetical protein
MTTDEVQKLLHAAPFVPFTVYLPSNHAFRIEHPDFATLSRGGRILAVSTEGDAFNLVDLMLATHVETHPPAPQATQS